VRLLKLDEGAKIATITKVLKDDDEDSDNNNEEEIESGESSEE
jgi:hypothetical protein